MTDTGKQGERMAAEFLVQKGYEILAMNYRKRYGEIDIIARRRSTLIFVEVKTRRSDRFGTPFDAVDKRKQRQLTRVAREYLATHATNADNIRFDVIAVHWNASRPAISLEHLENAFECVE